MPLHDNWLVPPMPGEDELRFQFLAEYSIDVICRAGPDQVLQHVSPSSLRVLGWTPREMIGKKPTDFVLLEDSFSLPGNPSSGFHQAPVAVRMRKKDGTLAWIEIHYKELSISATGNPAETVIVMRDITERRSLEERVSQLELTDSRTGISTPRAFDDALEREWNHTLRGGSRLSLLLVDFNQFKQFHEHGEHLEGDPCLPRAAAALLAILRATDLPAHYGVEGVAILLPSTGPGGAAKVAENVRSAVQALSSPRNRNEHGQGRVDIFIGIATVFARAGGSAKMPEILRLAAANALYKAKRTHNGTRDPDASGRSQQTLPGI
jgi:diguanylate cyclase (GGDEF)-like protein/PAS domain S-box-containing protein